MASALARALARRLPLSSIDIGLDRPSSDQLCAAWIDVEGWARARNGAPIGVRIVVGGTVVRELQPSLPRPDVADLFGDPRHARYGFTTRILREELPAAPRIILAIEAHGDTAAGRWRTRSRRMQLPIRLAPAAAPALSRGDFGNVWDGTAATAESAQIAVCGTGDHDEFQRSGRATADNIVALTGLDAGHVVLEIGCGVGRVGMYLAPRCGRWIGADVSPKMIEHARHNTSHLANVSYQLLNGYDLAPLASSSFDVVYCTGVFMHLDEWDRFRYVAEAHRVLRAGGRVYFNNIDALTDEGWKLFTEIALLEPAMRPANVSKMSTAPELENYARRAGFTDIRVHRGSLLVTVDAVKT